MDIVMARDTIITHEQVRKNQIKTVVLIILYIAIIIVLSLSIGYYNNSIELGALIAGFIILILLPVQILTGRKAIGSNIKWREIDTNDPKERDVLHLVEGLALAAGLNDTPKVYIVPSDVPNAFAGGLSLKNAYIGVTRGLIDLLDRPEIEGVIAHEMSHIVNRDILVSTVSIYLMSAAIILGSVLFRMNFWGGSHRRRSKSSKDGGSSLAILFLIGLVLSVVIRLVAKLINLAISRKREYMADATAVRICGFSDGLANALTKISGYSPQYSKEQTASLGGEEMLCLYIFNPTKQLASLFSTHPPIEKRIEILRNMY
jgi:heat shock protein HtpX